jgi:serine/arginine repetitive matrix protein 2
MLRSSTEMGIFGGTLGDGVGPPSRASQRRGTNSRMSTASSMSSYSTQTNRQHHHSRPSSSSAARHSAREYAPSGQQYASDTLSPTGMYPGSSPLVPPQGPRTRDSSRSSSMTQSLPQPAFRTANNRSTGNLRAQQPAHRSQLPYGPPQNMGMRPAHRPVSPTWTEMPGYNNRRIQTPANQGHVYPPGQMGRRMPSDASLGSSSRGYNAPPPPGYGPSRSQHNRTGYEGIPPMPPMDPRYKQYVAPVHPPFVAQGQRHVQRSVKGSASSGSTNMRTDSDTPSSDMAMPPTPTDGMSTNMLSSPPGIRMAKKTHATLVMGDKTPGSVDYYDGSEQWHNNEDVESEAERVPTGFVNQTKAVIEERAHSVAPGPAQPVASFEMSVVNRSSAVPTIAELPATPVGQRITRELVRKGLDPASTTGDATSTRSSPSKRDDMVVTDQTHDQTTVDRITDESSGASMLPTGLDNTHNSVLSQPSSNLANSSTIEFAVRYSIPAMTGSGPNGDRDARSEPPSTAPGSPDKSTDDGMSELLAGYQRTDTKQEDASVSAAGGTPKNKDLERASAHAHQSSDEQSFKSCTDVPISPESGKEAAGSPKPLQDILPDSQFPAKDSDARSFQTAKDVATPAHTISRPPSRLPSSGLDVEQQSNQPATDLSTPAQLRCKPVPPSHASIISSSSKLGGSSKPSIQQGSMAPMPGSLSTLGASQQPPVVPPRESSASAEAQRQNAVGSFLMRKVINPLRGSKGKKMAADEAASMKSNTDSAFSQPMQHSESMPAAVPPVPRPADVATAENVSTKQDVEPERKSSNLVESYSPTKDLSVGLTMVPAVHYSVARFQVFRCLLRSTLPRICLSMAAHILRRLVSPNRPKMTIATATQRRTYPGPVASLMVYLLQVRVNRVWVCPVSRRILQPISGCRCIGITRRSVTCTTSRRIPMKTQVSIRALTT